MFSERETVRLIATGLGAAGVIFNAVGTGVAARYDATDAMAFFAAAFTISVVLLLWGALTS